MAADDSSEAHPASSDDSIARYRLIGILRASRIETAESLAENLAYNPMIKGQGFLIETDDAKNNTLHIPVGLSFSIAAIKPSMA